MGGQRRALRTGDPVKANWDLAGEGTFEASAASRSAPKDFVHWTPTGDGAKERNQTCFRKFGYGRQASSRAKRTKGKSLKNELVHFSGVFPLFRGALCAPRGQRSWPCPGTVAGVKARWRKSQQHLRQKRRFSASLLTQKRSVPLPAKFQFSSLQSRYGWISRTPRLAT